MITLLIKNTWYLFQFFQQNLVSVMHIPLWLGKGDALVTTKTNFLQMLSQDGSMLQWALLFGIAISLIVCVLAMMDMHRLVLLIFAILIAFNCNDDFFLNLTGKL